MTLCYPDVEVRVNCPDEEHEFLACLTCYGKTEESCLRTGEYFLCEGMANVREIYYVIMIIIILFKLTKIDIKGVLYRYKRM